MATRPALGHLDPGEVQTQAEASPHLQAGCTLPASVTHLTILPPSAAGVSSPSLWAP